MFTDQEDGLEERVAIIEYGGGVRRSLVGFWRGGAGAIGLQSERNVAIKCSGDPHLDKLDVPVHVFWSDQDAFLTTDNAERLHKRLPKSALTIFENSGHFCYQDKG